jgi:hypothetical protein
MLRPAVAAVVAAAVALAGLLYKRFDRAVTDGVITFSVTQWRY